MDSGATILEITLVAGVYTVDDVTDLSPRDKFQWHNGTSGEVTLQFVGDLWDWTYTIGPGHYSPVHTIRDDAPTSTSVTYSITGDATTPPDPPSLGVGP